VLCVWAPLLRVTVTMAVAGVLVRPDGLVDNSSLGRAEPERVDQPSSFSHLARHCVVVVVHRAFEHADEQYVRIGPIARRASTDCGFHFFHGCWRQYSLRRRDMATVNGPSGGDDRPTMRPPDHTWSTA
jgi:hypothetical protein